MSDTPEMTKVPLNCHACGADFELYHDGVSPQNMVIICKCGASNSWSFQSPQPAHRYQGFGFKADDSTFGQPLPSNLRMLEA